MLVVDLSPHLIIFNQLKEYKQIEQKYSQNPTWSIMRGQTWGKEKKNGPVGGGTRDFLAYCI